MMKASWSATRKVIASISFVALAATGMTVAGSTAANAADVARPTYLSFDDADGWATNWWNQTSSGTDWWAGPTDAKSTDGTNAMQLSGQYAAKSEIVNKSGYKFTATGKSTVSFDVYGKTTAADSDVDSNLSISANLSTSDPIVQPWGIDAPAANVTKSITITPNAWNHVSFDFSTVSGWSSSATYKTFFIQLGFGHHWVDNISLNGGTSSDVYAGAPLTYAATNVSFEDGDAVGSATTGFDNAWSGIQNDSADYDHSVHPGYAYQLTKNDWACWGGFTIPLSEIGTALDSTNSNISFQIFSPRVNKVDVKIEGNGAFDNGVENVGAGWQTISVDVSKNDAWRAGHKYTGITIIPGWCDNTQAWETYFVDNVHVNYAPPTITANSPSPAATVAAKHGQAVTVTGTNLGGISSAAIVTAAVPAVSPQPRRTVAGVVIAAVAAASAKPAVTQAATVVASSATSVTVRLAASGVAQVGNLVLTGADGSATSVNKFNVAASGQATVQAALASSKVAVAEGSTFVVSKTQAGSATSVKVGTKSATFTVTNANTISVTAPANFADGDAVTITNVSGVGTASTGALYHPVTAAVSAQSGKVGDKVTVTGTNLGTVTAAKIGSKTATITDNTGTSLKLTIPSGATTATVALTVSYGTVTTAGSVTVYPAPTVTSMKINGAAVTKAARGASLVIAGTNLDSNTTVTVAGVSATITSTSSTSLTITIPSGAQVGTGKTIRITTNGGSVDKTIQVL